MAAISVPLEALAQRFDLRSRFADAQQTSVISRFSNLKTIGEFVDFKRLSKPRDLSDVQQRVNYNLSYFQSNYFALSCMLAIYSLLTNLTLLFDMIFIAAGLYGIKRLRGRDLQLGSTTLTTTQLYAGLFIIGVPIFIFASAIRTALWLVGAVGVTVLGHAAFMDKPIEAAFSEEAV